MSESFARIGDDSYEAGAVARSGTLCRSISQNATFRRVVSGTFPSPAHAEGHWLAASGAIKIYRATDSSKYCMARQAYCIFGELNEFSNLGNGLRGCFCGAPGSGECRKAHRVRRQLLARDASRSSRPAARPLTPQTVQHR